MTENLNKAAKDYADTIAEDHIVKELIIDDFIAGAEWMKQQSPLRWVDGEEILMYLFKMPLDIEGSNLSQVGWMPSETDKKYMGENEYTKQVNDYNAATKKVVFKNITLKWDSCDCSEYGCSHADWVYEIIVKDGDKELKIDVEEDQLIFNNMTLPIKCTVGDFKRACELNGFQLEFRPEFFDESPIPVSEDK